MRRIATLCLMSILLWGTAHQAQAKRVYGMAGCGLGSLVFQPDRGQISAATSNSTAYNQAFGITSGTSNCLEPDQIAAVQAQEQFVADNFSALSKEIAQGDGQNLKAFFSTFGCQEEAYPAFASHAQNSYEKIFAAPGAIAALSVIKEEMRNDVSLANRCQYMI